MPEVPVLFNTPVYQNIPEEGLSEMSALMIDGYVTELPQMGQPATVKRPGIASFADTSNSGSRVDGTFYWQTQDIDVAVCNGSIYSITSAGVVATLGTDKMQTGTRVQFVERGDNLYMVNGGSIVKIDGTLTVTALTITGIVDTQACSIASINKRLVVARTGSDRMYYTDANSDTFNGTTDSFVANSNPDDATRIEEYRGLLLVFGAQSIEMWQDTGSQYFDFQRDPAYILKKGCIASGTVKFAEGYWYYYDADRRCVRWSGAGIPEPLSTPYDRVIQGFEKVSAATSDIYRIAGHVFYVTQFPTADKTLVYDITRNEWHEWSYWNQTTASHERFLGQTYEYVSAWNKHLVGGRNNGKVGSMSLTTYQDWGNTIRTVRRTGHISHNTLMKKKSKWLKFKVQKGYGSYTAENKFTIRWKDNNGDWGNEVLIGLGYTGEYEFFETLRRQGTYYSRQYEFVHTHNSKFALFNGAEEIILLNRS